MGNPILDPILSFFRSIWSGLSSMWIAFVNAIGNWFQAVFSYSYAGIPFGPVIFVAISVLAFFMLWGFFKLRRWLRTS